MGTTAQGRFSGVELYRMGQTNQVAYEIWMCFRLSICNLSFALLYEYLLWVVPDFTVVIRFIFTWWAIRLHLDILRPVWVIKFSLDYLFSLFSWLYRHIIFIPHLFFISVARDCSVHRSFFRCYTVHATQGALLSRNTAFDAIGNCYYFEDGMLHRWLNILGISRVY